MKEQISGFELSYIVSELQWLVRGKVDKIFQPLQDEFLIRLHVPGKGKAMLRILLPNLFYLTTVKRENTGHPKGFCMFLRKRLTNARVENIEQVGMERIVKITFETKDTTYEMMIECFGKGNVILCEDYRMISLHKAQAWKDRVMKPGNPYQTPKRRPFLPDLSYEQFREHLGDNLVKSLAVTFGLGGTYAQEIVSRLKDQSDTKEVYDTVQQFIQTPADPVVLKNNEIYPFPLQEHSDFTRYPTFNEAIDTVFAQRLETEVQQIETSQTKAQKKLQRIIDSQAQALEDMEKKIEENQAKAHMIYNRYQELSKLLSDIHSQECSWAEIKETLERHPSVVNVDLKDKKIVLELQ
ncbi:MAG: NFACT family protein [Candidatus Woesearchaeota archaeon]